MTRLSLSDVVQAQEAMIERQAKQLAALTAMHAETLAALTEHRRPSASETVELSRAGTSGNPTVVKVAVVVQEGETEADAYRRCAIVYEKAAARYPLPNGYAHAAPLGDDENPRMPPTLVENLKGSVTE
jgi:hypothetical protein